MSVSNLEDARAVQLALPFGGVDRRSLDAAVDQVRDRFGSTSIGRTALVRRGLRDEAPAPPGPRGQLSVVPGRWAARCQTPWG